MTLEAFEILLSEWLNAPSDEQRQARVEDAIRTHPEFAAVRDAWLRCDAAMRADSSAASRVSPPRLHDQIRAAIDAEVASELGDARLERLLSRSSAPLHRVNWPAFSQRVAAAVDADVAGELDRSPVDDALHAAGQQTPRVDWDRFRQTVVEQAAGGAPRVLKLPQRERIAATRGMWRIGLVTTAVAAAALFLAIWPKIARLSTTTNEPGEAPATIAMAEISIDEAPGIGDAVTFVGLAVDEAPDASGADDLPDFDAAAEVAHGRDLYFSIEALPDGPLGAGM